MFAKRVAPYGTWSSPITARLIAEKTTMFSQLCLDGPDLFALEVRPEEHGRHVIVRHTSDGHCADVTPADFSARTLVHEYGGGDFTVADGRVHFANFADQRLYHQALGEEPQVLTRLDKMRYADLVVDRHRHQLLCVREDHGGSGEPVNTIAAVDLDDGSEHVLVAGADFYAAPRLSPDGRHLAWLSWNHPNMPWDGCELWLAHLGADSVPSRARCVAGGSTESIFQPAWSPDGELYFVSDRSGWWNLYRLREGQVQALCPMEAEFGRAQWLFGNTTYAFVEGRKMACSYIQDGTMTMAILDLNNLELTPLDLPYSLFFNLKADQRRVAFIGASESSLAAVVSLDVRTGKISVVRERSSFHVDEGYLSVPETIEFPTADGQTAHAIFYPPCNKDYQGPAAKRPPLIVRCHGGPTAMVDVQLRWDIQFWTSRGFAFLDVNYSGSTGYGRAYRQRLNGRWGIVDVQDCLSGTRYLVNGGLVDGRRLAIRGGSAGGYTTLRTVTTSKLFQAGASYFGVSDLERLHKETHKFESRYLLGLVGAYPEQVDRYQERSPVHHVGNLNSALILFQGLEDKIVPPNQSQRMAAAARRSGQTVAYLTFEGEQHGFRRAETIRRCVEAELYFYSRLFGFTPADQLEPVSIENL